MTDEIKLPRWIDDAKGKDPFTDDLIAEIIRLRAHPVADAGEAVGQIEHNQVHGWHFDACVPWDQIGAGTKLYRAAPSARTLSDAEIDDMCFGYAPSGKIGELRELVKAVLAATSAKEV